MITSTDKILGTIYTFPGCSFSKLVRKTGLSHSELTQGLAVLVKKNKIVIYKNKNEESAYEYWRTGIGYASFD